VEDVKFSNTYGWRAAEYQEYVAQFNFKLFSTSSRQILSGG